MGKNFIGMSVGQAARILRPVPPLGGVAGGLGEALAEIRTPEKVNRIDLFLEAGADREAAEQAAAEVVGNRAAVRTPDAQRRSTQEIVSGLQIAFLVCAAGAMIVGLFLVYNAMAVTVAERRPDIGMLRSVGATRGQIIILFSALAVILGLVGAMIGVPLGIGLAELTLTQFQSELESMFLNPDVNPSRISWTNAALAVLAGVSTAVFAALVPAIQAASDDPAHVVRARFRHRKGGVEAHSPLDVPRAHRRWRGDDRRPPRPAVPRRRCGRDDDRTHWPVALRANPRLGPRLVCPAAGAGGVPGLGPTGVRQPVARTGADRGCHRRARRGRGPHVPDGRRGRSNEEPVIAWIRQVVQADHFVFSGNMTSANSSNSPMSEVVARDIRALPSVDRVMTIRYARPEYNGTIVYLIAVDAVEYAKATRARQPSGLPDLEKFLELPGTNNVLVSENFTRRHNVRVGDAIDLPGPNGPVNLRMIGTVRDYSWSRGSVFMDRKRYAELFGDNLIDMCHVFLKPGLAGSEASAAALDRYAAKKGLFVTDRDSLRKFLSELIGRVYLLAYLQQIVIGVVAALGVVTALLISVLQRKRELGLLLAVGATPGQVLRSVLAEAMLMGMFGTVLGIRDRPADDLVRA